VLAAYLRLRSSKEADDEETRCQQACALPHVRPYCSSNQFLGVPGHDPVRSATDEHGCHTSKSSCRTDGMPQGEVGQLHTLLMATFPLDSTHLAELWFVPTIPRPAGQPTTSPPSPCGGDACPLFTLIVRSSKVVVSCKAPLLVVWDLFSRPSRPSRGCLLAVYTLLPQVCMVHAAR
jgi:hypothetical protein